MCWEYSVLNVMREDPDDYNTLFTSGLEQNKQNLLIQTHEG